MRRERFEQLVDEVLAELPGRYRDLLENIVILVRDYPRPRPAEGLLLGEFHGIPRTQKSVFAPGPPDQVFLYQRNIEAICETEKEVHEQVRLTLLHELGHYFGLEEEDLEHL